MTGIDRREYLESVKMSRYNHTASNPLVQIAYKLLSECAEMEYKTERGFLSFMVACQDCAMATERNRRKYLRHLLLKRTLDRSRTRAALEAYLTIFRIEAAKNLKHWHPSYREFHK